MTPKSNIKKISEMIFMGLLIGNIPGLLLFIPFHLLPHWLCPGHAKMLDADISQFFYGIRELLSAVIPAIIVVFYDKILLICTMKHWLARTIYILVYFALVILIVIYVVAKIQGIK